MIGHPDYAVHQRVEGVDREQSFAGMGTPAFLS